MNSAGVDLPGLEPDEDHVDRHALAEPCTANAGLQVRETATGKSARRSDEGRDGGCATCKNRSERHRSPPSSLLFPRFETAAEINVRRVATQRDARATRRDVWRVGCASTTGPASGCCLSHAWPDPSTNCGIDNPILNTTESLTLRRLVLAGLLAALALGLAPVATGATLPRASPRRGSSPTSASPTAMAFAPDGRLFIAEQGGRLRVVKNGTLLATPFVTLTVDPNGERGLLGVAIDPAFASNGYVYLYYTATRPNTHNRVSRFTASGDVAVAGSERVLLDLNPLSAARNHNGGAIHFGKDGKLYVAAGDNANVAQRGDARQPAREDPPDQRGRLDPDRQPVLQHGDRTEPRDLGLRHPESVHVLLPARQRPDVHQRRRAGDVGGDQRRHRGLELRLADHRGHEQRPALPEPALQLRPRQHRDDGLCDHGRHVLQPVRRAVPGRSTSATTSSPTTAPGGSESSIRPTGTPSSTSQPARRRPSTSTSGATAASTTSPGSGSATSTGSPTRAASRRR